MNKSIEKKLLHFFTSGDIQADFAAARKRKTSALRRLIRACFYVHLAAAVVCITLAAVLGAGTAGIAAVSLCEVVLLLLAFLAVGDMTLIKTLLCCGDTAFAAAMFVTGALISEGSKTPFFAIGAVMIIVTLCAFGAYYAAMCREFLDKFSPLAIRKEHYTLLPQLAKEVKAEDYREGNDDEDFEELSEKFSDNSSSDSSSDRPEEYEMPKELKKPAPPAPPKTEIQILADRLREILCTPSAPKNDTVADAMPKTQTESAPVIPEAPEYPNNPK